ncbi:MAG: GNAT family N-acetyltransferase [Kiritimatiellia bacterium]
MDNLKPLIRVAVLADANAIFELIKSHPEELISRALSDLVENIDRFVIAEQDGRLVGCASWNILPEIGEPERASVEIRSVAVRKAQQGTGVGSAMVRTILQQIRPLGAAQVVALTFAPAFFARLGFREVPKTQLMHKIYMGCVNCTKHANPFTCPEIAMVMELQS